MKQKTLITAATSTLVATLAVAGITYAATPAGNNTSLLNQGTVEVDSIKVGSTGSGGVTFFNGTIVNEGTQTPVTFGDDVRVDGRIWRGENQGPALGDNKPFIINDDTQVAGSFTVGGTDIFAAIDAKADKSLVTTNTSNIAAKANSADVYTKTQSDSNFVSQSSPSWSIQRSVVYGPSDIVPWRSTSTFEIDNQAMDWGGVQGFLNSTASDEPYAIPIHLTAGSIITSFTLNALDTDADAGDDIVVHLVKSTLDSSVPLDALPTEEILDSGSATVTSDGFGGISQATHTFTTPHVVDANLYEFRITFPDNDGLNNLFYALKLNYTSTGPQ